MLPNEELAGDEIDALIRGGRSSRRWVPPAIGLAVLVIAAVVTFLFVSGDSATVTSAPQPATAARGSLANTFTANGTANSGQTDTMTFGVVGDVAAVDVAAGDAVTAGQVLARLDTGELSLAVREAELNLQIAQEKLEEITGGATTLELANADLAVQTAVQDVASAEQALDDLLAGTGNASAITAAETAVTKAEQAFDAASNAPALVAARAAQDFQAAIAEQGALLAGPSASALDVALAQNRVSAALAVLTDANQALIKSLNSLDSSELTLAQSAVTAAEASVSTTQAAVLAAALGGDADEIATAEANAALALEVLDEAVIDLAAQLRVTKVRTALLNARESLSDVRGGASLSDIATAELAVAERDLALERAREDLENATIVAPFDGVVSSVGVELGDRVNANATAFVVTDPSNIVVDISVSETDVLPLEVGQVAIAEFDSIPDVQYPLRITSVGQLPTVSQGVVTYAVQAELLQGADLGGRRIIKKALTGAGDGGLGAGAFGGRGGFGGGGGATDGDGQGTAEADGGGRPGGAFGGGGGQGGGLAQLFEGVELPEGVTFRDVIQALSTGAPLPEGVTLPDGFELPEQLAGLGRGGGFAGGQQDGDTQNTATARPLPAPGMSASVTVLLDLQTDVVLVPVAAVRQAGQAFFVVVPTADGGTERVEVVPGNTDGTSVEIVSGLDEDATVLIGADTAGSVAYSGGQQTQQQPGFGGFGGFGGGGGFPGGGGGAGGGGRPQ
jgi:HlyD family secretion protein